MLFDHLWWWLTVRLWRGYGVSYSTSSRGGYVDRGGGSGGRILVVVDGLCFHIEDLREEMDLF